MKKKRSHRGERIGEEIRHIVSDLLSRELKDPALDGMISVSYVRATDDASFATIYFSSLGNNDEEVEAGFEKAKGFIRSEISRRLNIRRAPELRFKADEAQKYGQHIDMILDKLDLPDDMAGRVIEFDEISEIINAYERYMVFTHIHMDGDTFGSAVAFADAMHEIGREAWVVVGEEPPRTLEIINPSFAINADAASKIIEKWTVDEENDLPYLVIFMDFANDERLEGRESLLENAAESLCIDHHVTSNPTCMYSYIEPEAAATSEIIYRLLKSEDLPVTEKAATALYVGIVTDTGRFQYSNTTPETHQITADLLESGADFKTAYREIYQQVKAEKLFVQSAMLNTLDTFADGKAAMAFIKNETLVKLDAGDDETDGMSEVLRSIIGVEVSIFLKERPDGKVKASMRSKDWFDVAAFAAEFGGGGHVRAAGFTTDLSMNELCLLIKEKLTPALLNNHID